MSNRHRSAAGRGAADNRIDGSQDHILSIGVVAKMFKVPTLALRIVELCGLVRRQRVGRVKVYGWSDCERIALLVKGRSAGISFRKLVPVIKAMDESLPQAARDAGRHKSVLLINALERHRRAICDVLDELYRIDWELSQRLRRDG
ncbi:MAG TPA: hypothetical protein VHE81_10400 [Lacipirellulaceae bacterium]|nr:hypothetical protein [Lacipirellulaceae bacterium]